MIQDVVLQVPPVPPIPEVPTPPPWVVLPPEVIAMIALGFFAACALVLFPLMRAIARRIEGRSSASDPALKAELSDLRARLAEVEHMQLRLSDLEERVDFAERLLAQRREGGRVGPGGD